MLADQPPPETVAAVVAADPVVFIPAQTVMVPTAPETPVAAELVAVVTVAPEPLPEPEVPGGQLLTVATTTANVRAGPGKSFGVVGSLARGEQVLVVAEENPVDGWSRVRLEGDGIEGYVATRLLSE